ncbi:AMP dependent ligase/synthetase, putative [Entamoeba invadens IP1]|uniref:AMP dependent ligase/synthetase, putative n=1 Tax=Entamoeba invadens IP1 TaxID=370355 RepID=A0A0A1UGW4_ENTIV|nr:AMP dependent ligase/synthetase, putative [Entamoeba invadens IP1]ELP95219.1 AMP dependent ligase/synthetase, putative [Entamoeba invadens IP1]|eukprot:XP_004261990.1 AMP dependent ligase/synthetase, putative [Entamoeba invadens IP1]
MSEEVEKPILPESISDEEKSPNETKTLSKETNDVSSKSESSSHQSEDKKDTSSSGEEDENLDTQKKVAVSQIVLSEDGGEKKVSPKKPVKSPSPFPDIEDSVVPETLEEIEPFQGLSSKALETLSKYNDKYENGKSILQNYIEKISDMEGNIFTQEKVKVPEVSVKDFAEEIKKLTKSYISLNLKNRGVMFVSKNNYRVHALSLAAISAGMYTVHMNPSMPMVSLVEAVKQGGVVQLVCDIDNKDLLIELMKYVKVPCLLINGVMNDGFVNYDDFKKINESVDESKVKDVLSNQKPTDIAEIVFCEGPNKLRGVVWTHGNIISQCCALKSMFNLTMKDKYIMCHNMSYYIERLFALYLPMMVGYQVYIAPDVLYREGLKGYIEIAKKYKPTLLVAVPRFYEKLLVRLNEVLKTSKLATKVKDLAVDGMVKQEEGKSKPVGYGTSRTLVFNKGKEKVGIVNVKYFICAGNMPQSILKEVMGKGIEVFCGLPYIETTGFMAINREKCLQLESVGKPIDKCEVSLNGSELVCKGPNVSGGYTTEEIEEEFKTGCEAKMNNGFIEITTYSKTVLLTSSGEFIPYKFVENLVKKIVVVKSALVVGNERPYLSCILSVVYSKAKETLKEKCPTEKMLARDSYFGTFIRQRIDWLNKQLPKSLQIKRFGILLEGQSGTETLKEVMNFEDQKLALVKFGPFIEKLYVRGSVEKEGKKTKGEKEEQKKRRKAEKEREKEERKAAKAEKKEKAEREKQEKMEKK